MNIKIQIFLLLTLLHITVHPLIAVSCVHERKVSNTVYSFFMQGVYGCVHVYTEKLLVLILEANIFGKQHFLFPR